MDGSPFVPSFFRLKPGGPSPQQELGIDPSSRECSPLATRPPIFPAPSKRLKPRASPLHTSTAMAEHSPSPKLEAERTMALLPPPLLSTGDSPLPTLNWSPSVLLLSPQTPQTPLVLPTPPPSTALSSSALGSEGCDVLPLVQTVVTGAVLPSPVRASVARSSMPPQRKPESDEAEEISVYASLPPTQLLPLKPAAPAPVWEDWVHVLLTGGADCVPDTLALECDALLLTETRSFVASRGQTAMRAGARIWRSTRGGPARHGSAMNLAAFTSNGTGAPTCVSASQHVAGVRLIAAVIGARGDQRLVSKVIEDLIAQYPLPTIPFSLSGKLRGCLGHQCSGDAGEVHDVVTDESDAASYAKGSLVHELRRCLLDRLEDALVPGRRKTVVHRLSAEVSRIRDQARGSFLYSFFRAALLPQPATRTDGKIQTGASATRTSQVNKIDQLTTMPLFELPPICAPGLESAAARASEEPSSANTAGGKDIVVNVVAFPRVGSAQGRPPLHPMTPENSRRHVRSVAGGGEVRGLSWGVARVSTLGVRNVDFKNGNGRLRTPRTPRKRRGRHQYITQIQPVAPYPAVSQRQPGPSAGPSDQNPAKFAFSPELHTRLFGTGTNLAKHRREMKNLVTTRLQNVVDQFMSSILTEIDQHGIKMKMEARQRLRQKEADASGLSYNEQKKMASRREAEVTRIHRRSSHDALRETLSIFLNQFLRKLYVDM